MDTIELIDFSAVLRRAFERLGQDTIQWWRNEYLTRPAKRVFAFDSPPYWRAALYPGYKAHRKAPHPDWPEVRRACRELAEASAHALLPHCPGEEADDMAAAVVLDTRSKLYQWVLVTSDKDWLQLEDFHCRLVRPDGSHMPCYERLGVHPDQVARYLAIVGDAADGVPGCPGVGAVGAKNHLFGDVNPKVLAWMGSPEQRLADSLIRLQRRESINLDAFFEALAL